MTDTTTTEAPNADDVGTPDTTAEGGSNLSTPEGAEKSAPVANATPADDPETDETPQADPSITKARKEAAGYRERLRKAEAERDTASTTIESLRRQIIDGQATALNIKPAALWAAGYTVDDMLNEDGSIDPEAVQTAATAAREALGISKFGGAADQGTNKGGTPEPNNASWSSLLKP